MAIQQVFGRDVCQCDKCGHVWMTEAGTIWPMRCGNSRKRCFNWNSTRDTAAKQMGGETRKDQTANDFSLQYQKDDYSQE